MVIMLDFYQKKCPLCAKRDQSFQVAQIIFSLNIDTNMTSSTLKKLESKIKENDNRKL